MTTANPRRAMFLFLLLPLLLSSSAHQMSSGNNLQPGATFPDLALVGFDGELTSTRAFRGRTLVLNVWASWCAACRKEMASLQRLSEMLDRENVGVIGVSVDSDLFRAREYVRANALSFARFVDPDMRLLRQVAQIETLPTTFVIGPDGRLLQQILGARNWLREPAVPARFEQDLR